MMDLLLLKKSKFCVFINRCSNSLERLLFHLECQQNGFLDLFVMNTKDKKTSTF